MRVSKTGSNFHTTMSGIPTCPASHTITRSTMSRLYKGTFNWYGEVHIIWRWAAYPAGGERALKRALAKKLGVIRTRVEGYFNGNKDNFEIQAYDSKEQADLYNKKKPGRQHEIVGN